MPVQIQILTLSQATEAIRSIRYQVFHLEQGIPLELDWDGQDEMATHLLASWDQQAVGTARLRSLSEHDVKIERVAVLATYRQRGIGQQMLQVALAWLRQQNIRSVIVHAQQPSQRFYERLGFAPVGETLIEAGILHIKMVKHLSNSNT